MFIACFVVVDRKKTWQCFNTCLVNILPSGLDEIRDAVLYDTRLLRGVLADPSASLDHMIAFHSWTLGWLK